MIGLATRVWQHARLAEATTEALRKLTAAGVDGRPSRARHRRAPADAPTSRRSTSSGRPPRSARRSSSTTAAPAHRRAATRHLQPWGVVPLLRPLVRRRPRHRPRRGAGLPALPGRRARPASAGTPGSYDVPPGTDVRATAVRLAPAPPTGRGGRPGPPGRRASALRRDAASVEADVAGPDDRTGWDRVRDQPRRHRRRRRGARLRRRRVRRGARGAARPGRRTGCRGRRPEAVA